MSRMRQVPVMDVTQREKAISQNLSQPAVRPAGTVLPYAAPQSACQQIPAQ